MGANLEFTDDEYNILHNATFFIHKRNISEKIVTFLSEINSQIENLLVDYNGVIPGIVKNSKGKISRGENYEHLPYIILDSPRVFQTEDVFAFRTMFRWANYFSCTVQLAGDYLISFRPVIKDFITKEKNNNYYIGIGEDEWQHHFRPDNYRPVSEVINDKILFNYVLNDQPYFKAAIKLPLTGSAHLAAETINFYKTFLNYYCTKKTRDK